MTNTRATLIATLFFAGIMSLTGTAAMALSDGGSSDAGNKTPHCKAGYVWNAKKAKCVRSTTSSLDDKSLYTEGRDLALAGRYTEALTALTAVKAPDSMTLTMIGYAHRKMGDFNGGMAYYVKALALDPNNANTHEYLGELYVQKGQLDLAKAELVKVAMVCGTTCEQYSDLAKAIEGIPDRT